ncbi:hypothetical protein G7Y89_g3808 [Cudoniella acicularis]|uniref:Amino acid permease/ SLC12A domain-containing protein n=1 Tax=Cudoniella acicularis TaxID=354080 RepID=A0A8H4RSP8_9HELO|nr:hypothetical protein G7Y89_g3808 [Cudoniella acicularis]
MKEDGVVMQRSDVEAGSNEQFREELKRDLGARHINMIAISGIIGTGLFLSSGSTIAMAGPAGAWLAYIFTDFVTAGISVSCQKLSRIGLTFYKYTTGEITAFMPVTGGFVRHATAFIEPALGASTGWNFWYTMVISVPTELSAAATIVQFWDSTTNPAVWITVFLVVIVFLNFCGVRMYEESEIWVEDPTMSELVSAIGVLEGPLTNTFYGNIQVVALSGTETSNPRKIIPDAIKKTFYRAFFFYVLSILIVGIIVPYDSKAPSKSTGTAASSPFVIAFQAAGIKVLHSIINAVVCTSAISSGSACISLASRTLYGLSADGHAPKIFMRCNRFGTPWYAAALSVLPSPLVYMIVNTQASIIFGWFANIITIAGLIGWVVIGITCLRFYYGLKRQVLPYKSPLQPYVAYAIILIIFLIIFFSGMTSNLDPGVDLSPKIKLLYVFFKLYLKSKVVQLGQIDFSTELESVRVWKEAEGNGIFEEKKRLAKLWYKIF